MRRLLQAYTQAHRAPDPDHGRRIILEAVDDIQAMPELKHVDFSRVRRLTEENTPAVDNAEPSASSA